MERSNNPVPPEQEPSSEVQAFDLDVLTINQIVRLNRMINAGHYDRNLNAALPDASPTLLDLLSNSIEALPNRDPDKARELLTALATSEHKDDRNMAAYCAGSLLNHDYELTRDTLAFMYADGKEEYSEASEIAETAISDLEGSLTPEQHKDFEARVGWYRRLHGTIDEV
ncbi:hypothetical protein ABZ769_11405 [Streptomyces olivoreticuli]